MHLLTQQQQTLMALSAAALDAGDEISAASYHRLAGITKDQRAYLAAKFMNTNARHALECFLWSEDDEEGNPLDGLDHKCSIELLKRIDSDWNSFRKQAEEMGFDAEQHCAGTLHSDCDGDAWNAAAHDFILTRNHHGTGFWDTGRWEEPWDDRLTKLSHTFEELHGYINDENEIDAE